MKNRNAVHTDRLSSVTKPFLEVMKGHRRIIPPLWLMRQAGRYLPEYREVRSRSSGFLDMAYTPEKAVEVTMQPLRRYGMDAAILFSDILVVPDALGVQVDFVQGEGPQLSPIRDRSAIPVFDEKSFHDHLSPVYETVSILRKQIVEEEFDQTALIGFAGAPWTVACYMVEGGGSRDFSIVKDWAYRDSDTFRVLIDVLVEATAEYLIKQIEAGAEVLQIFDSWAGVLDERAFHRWVIDPTYRIVSKVREKYPEIPITGFPRGAGVLYSSYAAATGVTALSVDQHMPLAEVKKLQDHVVVQGNLDPLRLLHGGEDMRVSVEAIMRELSGGPFIFNLGHGVIKETPPEHVAELVKIVREFVDE